MAGLVAATEPPVAEGGFRDHRTPLDPQLQGDLELPASCADDVLPDDDAPLSVPDEAGDSEGGKLKMDLGRAKVIALVLAGLNAFVFPAPGSPSSTSSSSRRRRSQRTATSTSRPKATLRAL